MADPYRPDTKSHARPGWVKVLGIVALLVVLFAIVVLLAGGGQHGPSRHSLQRNTNVGDERAPRSAIVTVAAAPQPTEDYISG